MDYNNRLLELAKQIWPDPEISHINHMKFAKIIIEECAQLAEEQSRNYDGSNNEGAGCKAAAHAIRTFGKKDE